MGGLAGGVDRGGPSVCTAPEPGRHEPFRVTSTCGGRRDGFAATVEAAAVRRHMAT
jgi:hypothetical protein